MNIVIPMSGRGNRFSSVGYTIPKPLIEIDNKPIIEYAVNSLDINGDYIFIVQKEHVDKYNIDSLLNRIKPNCKIIETSTVTEGPACSALLAMEHINTNDELVIANCDQIMNWNSDMFIKMSRFYDGCVVTYHSDNPKNSFANITKFGLVTEIREKQPISNIGLTGIHYWKRALYFIDSVNQMISNNERYNNEFYIGPSYNYMIAKNLSVGIYHIPNQQYIPVGIPEDLELNRKNII